MLPNAFIGKAQPPTDEELAAELGASKSLWDEIVSSLALDQEWNSYSKKAGWALRLKKKERNIVYLGPVHGGFRVSFVLGDRAIQAAKQAKLPAAVLKNLAESKRYAEGTAVRLDIKRSADVGIVRKLAELKMAN